MCLVEMPVSEQEAILGLSELGEALKLVQEKRYDRAKQLLKEALKIVKRAKQERSMGYLFLLKRLAHICYLSHKFSDSEKYFKIAAEMTPTVSSNPANIFANRMNLLVLLTHTNLKKAEEYG